MVRNIELRWKLFNNCRAAEAARDTDILINNADVTAFAGVLSGPLEMIVRDMETNYYGTLNTVRAFVPVLEANGRS